MSDDATETVCTKSYTTKIVLAIFGLYLLFTQSTFLAFLGAIMLVVAAELNPRITNICELCYILNGHNLQIVATPLIDKPLMYDISLKINFYDHDRYCINSDELDYSFTENSIFTEEISDPSNVLEYIDISVKEIHTKGI
jgi:hypothetical protein